METWRTARMGLTMMRRGMLASLLAIVVLFLWPQLGVLALIGVMGALIIGSLMFTFGLPNSEARRLAITAFFIGLLGAAVRYFGNESQSYWDDGLNFLQVLGLATSGVAMAIHFGAWKAAAIEHGSEETASRCDLARIFGVLAYVVGGLFGGKLSFRYGGYYGETNLLLQVVVGGFGVAALITMWRAMTALERTLDDGSVYGSAATES